MFPLGVENAFQGRAVKGRTVKLNNIKSVWKKDFILYFKLVWLVKQVKGENIVGEILAIYITMD